MAKVSIEFDTVSKEMSLTFDGNKVDNVHDVYLSKNSAYYADEVDKAKGFRFNMMTHEKSSEDGFNKQVHISASEQPTFTDELSAMMKARRKRKL